MANDESFDQQVGEICRDDPRYSAAAYRFMQEAVSFTQHQLSERSGQGQGHITGQQLADGCRVLALRDYGPMARSVLAEWGVVCTLDFGRIVFNMAGKRLLGVRESDRLSDFEGVYDFAKAFDGPYLAKAAPGTLPVIDRP